MIVMLLLLAGRRPVRAPAVRAAANRPGANAVHSGSAVPLVRYAVTVSAVTGASSTPARKCPVARTRPGSCDGPSTGALSGVPGRRPATTSDTASSVIPGTIARASRSSSQIAPAVMVVSAPSSSWVAPMTSSPLSRGTR